MTEPARLLLLGGTTEAVRLAIALSERDDLVVITSLAGRTTNPTVSPGERRIGGFGGVAGLGAYLRDESIDAVVDATHPFAAIMRWNAFEACGANGIPRLRLERPGWVPSRSDHWTRVADIGAAATWIAGSAFRHVFLTTGRSELSAFAPAAEEGRLWLVRCIDPPEKLVLNAATVILDRGPFFAEAETELMVRYQIDLLVTKDSGGDATAAKLEAARNLALDVLVVERPPSPPGPSARTVDEARSWVSDVLGLGSH